MIKKIFKINSITPVLIIVIFLAIIQNFELSKNVFKIIKKNYDLRLIDSYKHYCHNESIGFLSHVMKKYKINKPIEIKNYFISPNPYWFFLQKNNSKKIENKMILLGYLEDKIIKFRKKKNYFISLEHQKELKNIKKIIFFSEKASNNLLKLEIYQESFGADKKKIYTINLEKVNKGKNIVELYKDFSNTLENSKIIVKFINNFKDNNLNINNLEFYKSNEIDLSKHKIYEKYESCYLISKHD